MEAPDKQITTRPLPEAVANLSERVWQLEHAVSELQPCPELPVTTLEAFETKPTLRVRIAHANTIKEGHRLSETTVEWTGPADAVDWLAIRTAMDHAYAEGTVEATDRQAMEQPS